MFLRIWKSGWWVPMLAVYFLWPTRVEAAPQNFNKLLRGDYAFSGEAVCLVSSDGFFDDFVPKSTPRVFSFSIQGVRTFNGDGTGSIVARTVDFRHSPASSLFLLASHAADLSGDFTYEVAADHTFTVVQGPVTRTVVAGPVADIGDTSVIEGINFSGYISQDHKTLVMSTKEPTVEIRKDTVGVIQDCRICHRARTAIKIK